MLALGQLADPRATPRLLKLLKGDSEEVRVMVCGALSTLRDERAVKPLIGVLKIALPNTRRFELDSATAALPAACLVSAGFRLGRSDLTLR